MLSLRIPTAEENDLKSFSCGFDSPRRHVKYEEMLAFVNKQCTITIDHKDEVKIIGLLKNIDEEGLAEILTDDGVRYCWPVLSIEK